MISLLLALAASIFLLMGLGHGVLTLRDLKTPRAFTPRDASLRQAMQQSSIALNPTINLWRAWLGFNLTHSMSLVMFGGAYLHLALFEPQLFVTSSLLQCIAVGVAVTYLVLCLKFFFSVPAIGSAIGIAGFLGATVLAHL